MSRTVKALGTFGVLAMLAFLVLALAGCGDSGPTGPETWDVSGQWTGHLSGVSVKMTLNENADGNLAGNGTFNGPSDSFAFDVSGTHVVEDVALTISASGVQDLNYSAEMVTRHRMRGALRGSGFTGDTLQLDRVP